MRPVIRMSVYQEILAQIPDADGLASAPLGPPPKIAESSKLTSALGEASKVKT